jgi:energy-coupling factor transport system permease protein
MKSKNKVLDHKKFIFAYTPGNSLMHNLNPLSKIIFLIYLTILTFVIDSLIFLSLISLSIIILALISGISVNNLFRKLRFIIIVLFISVILNIFFNAIPSNQATVLFYLFDLSFLPIRRLAVYFALKALFIVLTLFSSAIIYSNTTSMKEFVYALISIKIPYKYCFSFMIGIRYIPLIEEEARTVALAQKARGLGLEKANTFKKAYRLIFGRLAATLVTILRKSQVTSISMENRCFGISKHRTNLTKVVFKKKDYLFVLILSLIFLFLLLYATRLLPLPSFPSLYSIFLQFFP